MFKQGDYIMYSIYGVCIVDEIKEKSIDKEKRMYYILHPINEVNSKIMTPVDNKKVRMREVMTPDKAEEIFATIVDRNVTRIPDKKLRDQTYTRILKEGNPVELVEIINALIIEENEKIADGKKLSATDKKYIEKAEQLLFDELSISLNKEMDQIKDRAACLFEEINIK